MNPILLGFGVALLFVALVGKKQDGRLSAEAERCLRFLVDEAYTIANTLAPDTAARLFLIAEWHRRGWHETAACAEQLGPGEDFSACEALIRAAVRRDISKTRTAAELDLLAHGARLEGREDISACIETIRRERFGV